MGVLFEWASGLTLLMAIAGLAAVAYLLRVVRDVQARHRGLNADIAAALHEMERLAALCSKQNAHAGRLERASKELTERLEIMELRAENRSFDRAIDCARRGADPVRLERQFGLSQTEAGLVALLHGTRDRTSGETPHSH